MELKDLIISITKSNNVVQSGITVLYDNMVKLEERNKELEKENEQLKIEINNYQQKVN